YDRDELIEALAHLVMMQGCQDDDDWEHLGYVTVDSARLLITDPQYEVDFDAEERKYAREHGGFVRTRCNGRIEKCDGNVVGFVTPDCYDKSYQHTREIPLERDTSVVVVKPGFGDGTYAVEGWYIDDGPPYGRCLAEVRIR